MTFAPRRRARNLGRDRELVLRGSLQPTDRSRLRELAAYANAFVRSSRCGDRPAVCRLRDRARSRPVDLTQLDALIASLDPKAWHHQARR